jgi:hypothetical protein
MVDGFGFGYRLRMTPRTTPGGPGGGPGGGWILGENREGWLIDKIVCAP